MASCLACTRSATDLVADFWTGYHRTYVERDARLAGDISDWQQFGMFVRLIGALTAQEVNYSQLGREIGMTPQTAQRWLRVLEGTFQWLAVPAFKGNVVKRVSSKPKGHMTPGRATSPAASLSQAPGVDALPVAQRDGRMHAGGAPGRHRAGRQDHDREHGSHRRAHRPQQHASRMISRKTSLGVLPRAIRMPISRVRPETM